MGPASWRLPEELASFREDGGAFTAADARSGKIVLALPHRRTLEGLADDDQIDGKQHVAVAAGPNILAFAQPDPD